jgi:Tol biopolymer transport system component
MKLTLSTLFAGVSLIGINVQAQQKIDLATPPKEPVLFAENFISTTLYERDMAISPKGDEICYTVMIPYSNFQTIVYSKKSGDRWSKPEVISFSGRYSDLEPAFSGDGNTLFFASNRPVEGDKIKDFDIWYVQREGDHWSAPKNIGKPVNTEADEYYPSVASNGNLYYTAQYKGGVGREDIYLAKWLNGAYTDPQVLDTMVNSPSFEFNAFVSPDEQFILFSSQGRKDEKGRGDLYISVKDKDGKWRKAQNLAILNSDRLDYCPFVFKNALFFTSESHSLKRSFEQAVNFDHIRKTATQTRNGSGNIYWVDVDFLKEYFR